MKQKLLFLGMFISALAFNTAFAQTSNYTQAQPFQNYSNYGDTITFTFTSTPGSPVSNAQIEVFYEGDFGYEQEIIHIYDENWNYIGKTNFNANYSDCEYDSTLFNLINLAALNAAASDGNVIFYALPSNEVDFFCTESRIKATLSYTYCNSAFTQYPTLTVNANTNQFCPSDRNVAFTAVPAGGSYTTSAGTMNGNNFYIGNLVSGSYTISYSVSQNGCTASDSKTIEVLRSFVTNVLDTTMCANNNGIQLNILNPSTFAIPTWYDNNNFTGALATNSNSLTVSSISQNTTYYIRDEEQDYTFGITSLTNANHVVVDHNSLSGDDRGSIAVTATHVYYVGDNNTVRYDLDLTPASGISLPIRDGIFSDLRNGNLYTFHNGTDDMNTNNYTWNNTDFVISEIRSMDADLNIASSATITLSIPITIKTNTYSNIVYAGRGFVGIFTQDNSHVYVIDLDNGEVSDLGEVTEPGYVYGSESWAEYGILEFDGTNFYGVQRGIDWNGFDNYDDLVRFKLPHTDTIHNIVQTFSDLGDAYTFTYWPANNRLYAHIEGTSDFGNGSENLAYISGTHTSGLAFFAPCVATVNVTIDACAGIEENEAFNFNVYPNPAREALTIEVSENSKMEIYAYDGKLVVQENITNRTVLNVSNFNNGIYFIRLTNEAGETFQTKIVKQ